ncbi:hypothetical protein NPIL_117651 [Nephila pilipes]|uniref:Uncharacterized protein n=1 Tax=Nephila pilipes TaxID=299642 RepID=A0A8X6QQZ3_NEPPI|nr:hypothetical protein NPIL_117651 [Nephila pilipes]
METLTSKSFLQQSSITTKLHRWIYPYACRRKTPVLRRLPSAILLSHGSSPAAVVAALGLNDPHNSRYQVSADAPPTEALHQRILHRQLSADGRS